MKKSIIYVVLPVCLFLIFFPFVLNYIYHLNPFFDFFIVDYESNDLLEYYGVAFSFLGTIILSTITIIQNKKSQEQTDEINRLMIKLQKKSMEIAEKQFDQATSNDEAVPKFEIKLLGHNGRYSNPYFSLRNVSSIIISDLKFISLCAKDDNDVIIGEAKRIRPTYTSLGPNQVCNIESVFPELKNTNNLFRFILAFSCEDERGKIHYFKSHKNITNLNLGETWKTEKVG